MKMAILFVAVVVGVIAFAASPLGQRLEQRAIDNACHYQC